MTQTIRILMVNDHANYNARYRAPLIASITARGHAVETIGVQDRPLMLPRLALRLLFGQHGLVLSSNLKANAFTLLFCRRPKVVIVNGLGRFRGDIRVRTIFRRLLGLRRNTFAIVQNYADYRYLRRFCPHVSMEWMPGSGGREKLTGDDGTAVLVQRDNKIALVAQSVRLLFENLKVRPDLTIVGCEDKTHLARLFPGLPLAAPGYLPAEDIFRAGSIFLQPEGYGEGFPHSLADAIVSGMDIYIAEREFLRYGLAKLGARRMALARGWCRLVPSATLIATVRAETIAPRTAEICETQHRNK